MNKKIILLAGVFAFAACGGKAAALKEYGEALDVATKKVGEVSTELKGAADAKAAAAAINKFYQAMHDMKVKGDELDKKHNLKMKGDQIPDELKPKFDAFMAAAKSLGSEVMPEAMKKYGADPEVQEALKKLESDKDKE